MFVYCEGSSTDLDSFTTRAALRLVKSECKNPVLKVTDPTFASKLNMKPGNFYCYYKPTWINGFANP